MKELYPINESLTERATHVAQLITLYVFWSLSQEQHDRLDEWVGTNDDNMQLFENLTDTKRTEQALIQFEKAQAITSKRLKRMKGKLHFYKSICCYFPG